MKIKKKGLFSFWHIKSSSLSSIMIALYTLLVIMILGGCASARFIMTGPSFAAKQDDCYIEVFSTKIPDREYEELGIIEGEGFFGGNTMEMILPKMKREACRAGGDGIILTSYQKYVDNTSDEKLNITATVIRWME